MQGGVSICSFGIQVATILDEEVHYRQGSMAGDSDGQVQGELSWCLPIRPWQQLSEVLPIGKGLQDGEEVPAADGCP